MITTALTSGSDEAFDSSLRSSRIRSSESAFRFAGRLRVRTRMLSAGVVASTSWDWDSSCGGMAECGEWTELMM